jgi:hypothetical protein
MPEDVPVKIECRVCGRPTNAFLCAHPCAQQLEEAFGDLPGLVADVVTVATGEANAYRYTSRRAQPDAEGHDAGALLRRAGNTLTTWARHLAEVRGVPLVLTTGQRTEGPICAAHVHDFTVAGCGTRPGGCKQLHPDHVHDYTPKGCGHDRDPDTGELTCGELHCDHPSCVTIRDGEHTGTAAALVRWFLHHRNAIRYDEAAAEMFEEILDLRDELRRFVDRSPAPFFAGPCHAATPEPDKTVGDGDKAVPLVERGTCHRDLYAWINPFAIDPRDQSERPTVTCNGYGSRAEGDHGCGAVHTLADRGEWLVASVDDALLPLATWQAALPRLFPALTWPNRSTWWRWTSHEEESKRRLLPKSIDRSGVELFRGGDIVDLVHGEQARIRGNAGKSALDKRSA